MLDTTHENTTEALMAAFQRGAGVQPNWHLTPEFMEMLGKLVAASIGGAHQLLEARAELKRDIHADATIVVVRNNNPLKFLPDSQSALTQMLRKKMPGFMGPVEALEDAFADLQQHQSCVMAGMEGAVAEALARLAPSALEAQQGRTLFRKAALWDRYCAEHAALAEATAADFHGALGDAFLGAYERRLDEMGVIMADMPQRLVLNVAEVSSVGGRASNQDAIGRAERGELACFVVSDGAGGHEGGEVASRTVVQAVLSAFDRQSGFDADAPPHLVAEAAIAVARGKLQRPALKSMSATVALAVVDRAGAQGHLGHMGDTRIYLFREGRLLQATRDHSMVQQMIDAGLAAGADPRSHPKRNVLYAAIGTENEVLPSVQPPLALCAGDAILICTDGLWEWVAEPQMELLLSKAGSAQEWLSSICALADERAGLVHKARDNFSAQAIFIGDAP